MSNNPDKDELTMLRVPPRIAEKINAEIDQDDEDLDLVTMAVECVKNTEFKFIYGTEEYHATLVNLPTLVETQKTIDNITFYQNGNVGQMILVHDVPFDQPRPLESPSEPVEYDSGISAPMTHAVSRRFSSLTNSTFDTREVEKADLELYELAREFAKRDEKERLKPLVYEELIDADPIMDYFDDVTIIDEGDDNFKTNTRAVIEGAYQRYLVDKKARDEAAPPPESNPPPAAPAVDDSAYLAALLQQQVAEVDAAPADSGPVVDVAAAPVTSAPAAPVPVPAQPSEPDAPVVKPAPFVPAPSPSPSPVSANGSTGFADSQPSRSPADDSTAEGPSVSMELQSALSSLEAQIERKTTEEKEEENKLAAILNPSLKLVFQRKRDAIVAERKALEAQREQLLEKMQMSGM